VYVCMSKIVCEYVCMCVVFVYVCMWVCVYVSVCVCVQHGALRVSTESPDRSPKYPNVNRTIVLCRQSVSQINILIG